MCARFTVLNEHRCRNRRLSHVAIAQQHHLDALALRRRDLATQRGFKFPGQPLLARFEKLLGPAVRRQSSATLSSPRRPSSTIRILSSAEKCRRVARRMFLTTWVAGSFSGIDFCLIFAPQRRYDEPEILPSSIHQICLTSAGGGHSILAIGLSDWLYEMNALYQSSVRLTRLGFPNHP
jgi:hypothetical protein